MVDCRMVLFAHLLGNRNVPPEMTRLPGFLATCHAVA
jgi:hypothetical protein